jgi:Phosphomannomutase
LGLKQAYEDESDLLIATDPDADRIGIAVRYNNEYKLLTGNEVGIILTDFLIKHKKCHGKPIVIKTIVTTSLVDKICKANNVEIRNVYTGFKYIGEQIADLEKHNELNRYLLGFEESYGYLVGTYVRDKDSISAAMIICEAASIYKKQNKTLYDVLMELYKKYGYVSNNTFSYKFDGYDGNEKMKQIFHSIRQNRPVKFGSCNVESIIDYLYDDTGLRKSNVIQYNLEE